MQLVKTRIKRINENFDLFHEAPKTPKRRSKCFRLEVGALLSKAAILMGMEAK